MSNPDIALCIPAFNASKHLPKLLRSAKNQRIPFDEIIVYDDASNDGTGKVAQNYGADVIKGDKNRGPSVGRNKLSEYSSSNWIHFHDADDILYPSFVERAKIWTLKEDPPDVVLMGYEMRKEDGSIQKKVRHTKEDIKRDPLSYCIKNQTSNCGIYRRSAFLRAGGADEDKKVMYDEDDAMHMKLAYNGLKFDADQKITSIINIRQSSFSRSNREKCLSSVYYVLKKYADKVDRYHKNLIAHELWKVSGGLAAHSKWELAREAVELAKNLAGRTPNYGGTIFRLTGIISPTLSLAVHPRTMLRMKRTLYRYLQI